ncbi:helix-turn-helix transcriptional regulator [Erwiniaceae bacterium BAC15a-03b]|uniref:Helix-turn-helix transcriptional regulator n=1 Tax=Winslowiella arboricola TaxID=2978220 RepID=A0A9J6PN11_9GAMM|nr:helix-turn-helix domain-containing protein [Winslowiella arboricola]MCU5775453.1 helix-turn-helix transcriptional regulator [Winslowiella arboricola]MCU5779697.1 helix-turn-helix transcriptional regulator [Winslowiella arboricola]
MANVMIRQLKPMFSENDHNNCPAVMQLLDRVGNKWTIIVMGILTEGPMRFNAIQRSIEGLSHRVLTLTLRGLERDGLVERRAFPTIPPKVEYELTLLGISLIGPVEYLMAWVRDHRLAIDEARDVFDRRNNAE